MWNGMDRAAVEAILGKGVVWGRRRRSGCHVLADKACSGGLTVEEQSRYDALQELYCSGI